MSDHPPFTEFLVKVVVVLAGIGLLVHSYNAFRTGRFEFRKNGQVTYSVSGREAQVHGAIAGVVGLVLITGAGLVIYSDFRR